MRTIDEMTQLEIQLSGNVLRLITCLRYADTHIAHLFKDEWDEYLKKNQLQ